METTVIKQLESTRWEIMVKKADLLNMIKVVALYHIRKTPKEKLPIILHEVTDEDMPIIISYIENSLSGLLKLISNYLSKPFSDYNIDPNFFIFELSMPDGANDSIIIPLGNNIENYIVHSVLSQWFGMSMSEEHYSKEIKSLLNYRKYINLKVRPIL